MRVLVTGATGFLGHAIARELLGREHELVVVTRDPERARDRFPFPARMVRWDPMREPIPGAALEGVGGAIHLAGESLAAHRWSAEQKRRILGSRVLGTRHFWEGLAQARARGQGGELRAWVAGSAIGYYGDRGSEWLTEDSSSGQGFLSEVCRQWEREIFRPDFGDVRQAAVRSGMVLGTDGGALVKLLPLFKAGLGGPVGSGKQWVSWIHEADAARLFVEALETPAYGGVINGVAGSETNHGFAKALGHLLGRPTVLPAPAFALRLALGEMAHVVLDSQRVRSERLGPLGFQFRFGGLEAALRDLCGDRH